jgi:hypothetical protein
MRVTLDLDSAGTEKFRRAFWTLYRETGRVPEVRVSAGGRGFHLIVRDLPITFEESLRLRKLCGDDPQRIRFDEESWREGWVKPKQILWRKKIWKDGWGEARKVSYLEALRYLSVSKSSKSKA